MILETKSGVSMVSMMLSVNKTNGIHRDTLQLIRDRIIVMIENYRTGLLWNLFMSAGEIQKGLNLWVSAGKQEHSLFIEF